MTANPIVERTKDILSSNNDLKVISLPEHLMRLRDICVNSESDVKDAVPVMNEDPGFMSYIIKTANSAYYNPASSNVSDINKALIRIGFYFVGNYSILYATKTMHDIENGPEIIIERLKMNWNVSIQLSDTAMGLLDLAKKNGIVRNEVEISKLMTTSVLYHVGNLCCIALANQMISEGIEISVDQMIEAKNKLSKTFLRRMLIDIGYDIDEVNALIGVTAQEGPINYIDFIHAGIIKNRTEKLSSIVTSRLKSLEIL